MGAKCDETVIDLHFFEIETKLAYNLIIYFDIAIIIIFYLIILSLPFS